jgi:hypothetical protein
MMSDAEVPAEHRHKPVAKVFGGNPSTHVIGNRIKTLAACCDQEAVKGLTH